MTGIICSMVGASFSSGAPITAVTFDGTGDYYEKTSLTSTASSATKFVVALTYNTNTTSGQTHMINMYSVGSTTYGFYIWINSGRSQLVVTQGTTGSEVYNVYTGTTTVTTGAWENIVWYFDMASFANTKCYKNGVSQSLTQASFNGTLSLNFNSISQIKIGQKNTAQTATGSDYNGKIAQVYVNAVTAEPSISYFWDSVNSLPHDLGTDGTASGLPQPYVYHYGKTSTFVKNNGAGFNTYTLTANGNLADTAGPTYPTARTAKTITAVGNAQISTAQSVFGGASALFDGTGDSLSISPFALTDRSSNFTLEARVRLSTLPSNNTFRMIYGEIQTNYAYASIANRGGVYTSNIVVRDGANFREEYMTISSIAANTWYHWAIEKDGATLNHYWNGTKLTTANFTQGTMASSYGFNNLDVIGRWNADTNNWNGNLDEMRVSNIARYRANFTVPTEPFVNDANTTLLLHCNGTNASTTFTDDAGRRSGVTYRTDSYASFLKLAVPFDNDFGSTDVAYRIPDTGLGSSATKTQGANVSLVTTQVKWTSSPNYVKSADFAPGAAAMVYTLPESLPSAASGTWVIEGWFRPEGTTGFKWTISSNDVGGRFLFSMYALAEQQLTTSEGNQNFLYLGTPSAWVHVAIVCDGGTKRVYQNGKFRGNWLGGSSGFTALQIGQQNNTDANDYDGQIQDLRVYIGTNKGYTGTNTTVANFTVPSSIIESY